MTRYRLQRAVQGLKCRKQSAIEKWATGHAVLILDGTEDPQAEVILAKAGEQTPQELYGSVLRRPHTVKLMARLFEEQQKVLADCLTQDHWLAVKQENRGFKRGNPDRNCLSSVG